MSGVVTFVVEGRTMAGGLDEVREVVRNRRGALPLRRDDVIGTLALQGHGEQIADDAQEADVLGIHRLVVGGADGQQAITAGDALQRHRDTARHTVLHEHGRQVCDGAGRPPDHDDAAAAHRVIGETSVTPVEDQASLRRRAEPKSVDQHEAFLPARAPPQADEGTAGHVGDGGHDAVADAPQIGAGGRRTRDRREGAVAIGGAGPTDRSAAGPRVLRWPGGR